MTETDTKMMKKKKNKKVTISEDDMSLILRRYSATTIIALLQEVSQFLDVSQCPDAKINWNELVKKTSTGITSPREYQMLWRNLAYRDDIEDNLADRVEPLDDDSDLESELEAFPAVSAEASTEAAACAKVLLASGSQNNLGPANHTTVEAPLTINIPNGQSSRAPSVDTQSAYAQGTNITVPVSVQKQSLPSVASTEALEGNGAAGFPPRRKRKPWTEEEDIELIAAVQKCGERNWANILKGDFKGDRTASQLSQRWAIIRKRQANKNPGGTGNKTTLQLSEQQLANRAVSHALNMPVVDSLLAACSAGSAQKGIPLSSAVNEASLVPNILSQTLHQKGIASITSKSRATSKKGVSSSGSDSMVQAAAVAAGARIVTPSTAASLLKVSQSKNAFLQTRPAGGPAIKSPMPSGTKPLATNPSGTTVAATSTKPLAAINPPESRTNVHHMRLVSPSSTDLSPGDGSKQDEGNPMGPAVTTDSVPATIDTKPNLAALQMISAPSSVSETEEVKKADTMCTDKDDELAEEIKPDVTESVGKDTGVVSNSDVLGDAQMSDAEVPGGPESMEVDEINRPPLVKVKTES